MVAGDLHPEPRAAGNPDPEPPVRALPLASAPPLVLTLLFASGCVVLDDPEWLDELVADDDDAVDDDDDDDAPPCTDPDDPANWVTEPPADWLVSARFVLPDGEPVRDLMITLCGSLCFNEPTNCDGVVYFPVAFTDRYVLEPLFAYQQRYELYARSFDLIEYDEADGRLDLMAPYTIPIVEEIEPVGSGPQERTFASGVQVSFDADAITLPFGPESGSLGSIEIPPERFPVGGLLGWTPLRVVAFAVWEMTLPAGPAFQTTVPLTEAVPEGDEVAFLVAHYDYSIVEGTFEVFPAELTPDRLAIKTPANQGLERSTMWIAARRTP